MHKTVTIGALLVLVALVLFVALACRSRGPSTQALFQARLEAARAQSGAERVVEGRVRASAGTSQSPRGGSGVAWAVWEQVRTAAGSDFYKADKLELGGVPFTLETSEGPLLIDGTLRGLSDLVPRERGPTGPVELTIVDGDQVTVLGPLSERDGVRGMFGEFVIVKGSYAQWHAALDKTYFESLPYEPN